MKFLEFIIWRELTDNLQLVRDRACESLFVNWHFQMVFASSEALMAVVHHSAFVSCPCRDMRNPTQVNDQSFQRK